MGEAAGRERGRRERRNGHRGKKTKFGGGPRATEVFHTKSVVVILVIIIVIIIAKGVKDAISARYNKEGGGGGD